MRHLLTIATFLFICQSVSAQTGTSPEEYRYMNKGFAYQKQMGLDPQKEGYYFKKLSLNENEEIELTGMYSKTSNHLVGIVAGFKSNSLNKKQVFIGIPNAEASNELVSDFHRKKESSIGYENRRKLDEIIRKMLFAQLDNSKSKDIFAIKNTKAPETEVLPQAYANEQLVLVAKGVNDLSVQPKKAKAMRVEINEQDFVQFELTGQLTKESLIYWPKLQQRSVSKGTVNMKICIDEEGQVSSSRFTQKGSTLINTALIDATKSHSRKVKFEDGKASCGVISYVFR